MTDQDHGAPGELQKLADNLRDALPSTTFEITVRDRSVSLSVAEYRTSYAQRREVHEVFYAKPVMAGHHRSTIEHTVSTIFADCIEDGSVGNGFAYVSGGSAVITVADLADSVTRASAILGPDHATAMVGRWASGERIKFSWFAILEGVSVDETLGDKDGLQLYMVPASPDPFSYLPVSSEWNVAPSSVRGKLRAAIACEAGLAFFPPSQRDSALGVGRTWAHGPLPDDIANALCRALSLRCNRHVDWTMRWTHCAEGEPFGLSQGSGYGYKSGVSHADSVAMSQADLDRVLELLPQLSGPLEHGLARGLTLSVDRWVRSKAPRYLADQLIDLRIALEALFLDHDDNAELAFRLATRGAWYLGKDARERKRIAKDLRIAYRTASRVIHAGSAGDEGKDRVVVLERAQDLCRSAILKMMDEPGGVEWEDVIMGASDGDAGTGDKADAL